jgi:membrane protein
MESRKQHINLILQRPGKFLWRVLVGFKRNQGLLLAGAVAYYTLLSVIPMLALILVGLSHFIEEQQLYNTILTNLKLVIPAYAESVTGQVWGFLARRQLVGIVGILVMLFFSSMAFTVLENAMAIIFSHRARKHRRHFLISAIIPYAYIFLLGIGLLIITLVAGALGALSDKHLILLGWNLSLEGTSRFMLYLSGMAGMVIMLTSLYLVMPLGHIPIRYALAGGVTAAVLWEIIRHILVWYYSTISLVNVIYGSLATAVVALLSIEIAVIILLLGAQVIAEFEHSISETAEPGQSRLDGCNLAIKPDALTLTPAEKSEIEKAL